MFFSVNVHAHLLNMSVIHFTIVEENRAELSLELDLAREFESNQAYFLASQLKAPLDDANIRAILDRIFSSIELQVHLVSSPFSANTMAKELIIFDSAESWVLEDLKFLETQKTAYFDPLSWPKVHIFASIVFDASLKKISARFKSDFIFEEPISFTLEDRASSLKKTRWLIAYQQSPSLVIGSKAGHALAGTEFNQVDSNLSTHLFYFVQGFKHVVPLGLDHLLFVLALAFGAASIRSMFFIASLFTLAHGLTLFISVYGVLRVPAIYVEPLIALSIAWAGWSLAQQKRSSTMISYSLIFLFGLVHGLGFAGAMSELDLPVSGALLALLGFNLGIEAAQVLVMCLSHILLIALIAVRIPSKEIRKYLGFVLCAIGIFWGLIRVSL